MEAEQSHPAAFWDHRSASVQRQPKTADYDESQVQLYALTADSPRVLQPEALKVQLKAHQLAVIARARAFEAGVVSLNGDQLDTQMGVLCDYTGAGKSHQILGLIAHHPYLEPRTHLRIKAQHGRFSIVNSRIPDPEQPRTRANLLIVPQALLPQWVNKYLKETTLTYLVVDRPSQAKAVLPATLDQYQLVVVSSNACKDLYKALPAKLLWSRVIIDEADSINVPSMPEFSSAFWWFVTATPGQLLAKIPNMGFIRNIFSHGALLGITNCFIKCQDDFVARSFELPEPLIQVLRCRATALVRSLNGIVAPDVQNALAAGDIPAAIAALGVETLDANESVVSLFTRALTEQIAEKEAELVYREQVRYSSASYKVQMLKELEDGLVDLKNKKRLLEERLAEQICYICFDEPTAATFTKCCNRVSCFACITTYLLTKGGKCQCPNCRASVTKNELVTVQNSSSSASSSGPVLLPTKLEMLELWLTNHVTASSKILFFSEYEGSFEKVIELLTRRGISFGVLTGGRTKLLQEEIKAFQQGLTQVLLTNSFEYGSGFNLEIATDVILYHKMGVSRETQAIGRAQRPGRALPLQVSKFYHEEECDRV